MAGERALRRLAESESTVQFRRGIDLLQNIPWSARSDALEFRLKPGLAGQLSTTQGYASPEVVALLGRALDLIHQLADTVDTFGAMCSLHYLLSARSEHRRAYELCEKFERLAEKTRDPILRAEASRMRGRSAYFLGHCSEARESYEWAVRAHRREDRKGHPFSFSENPDAEVNALSVLSNVLWLTGYPEQALQRAEEARAVATKNGILYSIAVAEFFLNDLMYFLRRDASTIMKQAEFSIAFCKRNGFALWLAQIRVIRGWALVMLGRAEEGINEIESAFANGVVAAGASVNKLVEAFLHTRKTSHGLRAVERGLKLTQEREDRTWEPDLHRLKGELLLQRVDTNVRKHTGDIDLAERCFLTAIERARSSDAKSLELRAAISLYRLRSKQGNGEESRRILADAYDWFTEGKDTPDLADARHLLENRRS
jgi:tetratricopeptide (TPR) repeat protein